MPRQRMDDDRGVFARFHHFVEVADAAVAHRAGQRPVDPHRFAALDQVATNQIGGGQIVMTGNRHHRALQVPGHVFDEARLAAAGRALEQQRQLVAVGRREHLDLVADDFVVRLFEHVIFVAVYRWNGHAGWPAEAPGGGLPASLQEGAKKTPGHCGPGVFMADRGGASAQRHGRVRCSGGARQNRRGPRSTVPPSRLGDEGRHAQANRGMDFPGRMDRVVQQELRGVGSAGRTA